MNDYVDAKKAQFFNSTNSRTPVVLLEIAQAHINTKNLKFRQRPVQSHRGIQRANPTTQPQTLYFELVSDQNSLGNLRIYFCTFAL